MVRIDRNRKNAGGFTRVEQKELPQVTPGQKSAFGQELMEKEEQGYRQHMQEILRQIDDQNSRLAANLNVEGLVKYKKLVQEFLQEVTGRAYLVNRESSFTRRGARSILVSVKKINQEVEQMLDDFIGRKAEPFEVLKALDKIRGMLVDLLA